MEVLLKIDTAYQYFAACIPPSESPTEGKQQKHRDVNGIR